ncbi:Hypothetical protein GLP15_1277 [Giardia lamblia P15]|uniref:Uncharacterized protein n=1 Tax=Giardia intestinalis (strain P15) TaxID=658858 RepID=E1EZN6_GIAIA|nr:Hypothetical protein GLP15_1277 [Giardia lamblia P15]
MNCQEPKRKIAGPSSPLPQSPSNSSTLSPEHLYMLDTSSDRMLEIDLATIPTGPSDGPAWAQHNFSYLDLPVEPVTLSERRSSASETKDIADNVASVLDGLLSKDISSPDVPHKMQPVISDEIDASQCSSTESELAKLY